MADEREDLFLARLWEAYTHFLKERRGKDTSQAQIAREIAKLGGFPVRQDDVSRWLRGAGRPEYEELTAVASVLGVRHHWLAFNEGSMLADDGGVHFPEQPPAHVRDAPLVPHHLLQRPETGGEVDDRLYEIGFHLGEPRERYRTALPAAINTVPHLIGLVVVVYKLARFSHLIFGCPTHSPSRSVGHYPTAQSVIGDYSHLSACYVKFHARHMSLE